MFELLQVRRWYYYSLKSHSLSLSLTLTAFLHYNTFKKEKQGRHYISLKSHNTLVIEIPNKVPERKLRSLCIESINWEFCDNVVVEDQSSVVLHFWTSYNEVVTMHTTKAKYNGMVAKIL